MTTNTTKTATVAAVALTLVAAMLAYSAMVLPASAQTAATTSTSASTPSSSTNAAPGPWVGFSGASHAALQGGPMRGDQRHSQQQANLAVGQTITVSSTKGMFYVVGNAKENGTASGTITFKVTGKLAGGFTLSITQGSIVVNGTTYTVSSGSAQMDRAASGLVGQGATTPSGQFLIRASAHGSFVGTTATMSLDLNTGTTEDLVFLAGSVQG